MPSSKVYTWREILDKWNDYTTAKVLQVTKGGVKEQFPLNGKPVPRIDGTKAEVIEMKKVMEFPAYLQMKMKEEEDE